jgi:hypothetical protein
MARRLEDRWIWSGWRRLPQQAAKMGQIYQGWRREADGVRLVGGNDVSRTPSVVVTVNILYFFCFLDL